MDQNSKYKWYKANKHTQDNNYIRTCQRFAKVKRGAIKACQFAAVNRTSKVDPSCGWNVLLENLWTSVQMESEIANLDMILDMDTLPETNIAPENGWLE